MVLSDMARLFVSQRVSHSVAYICILVEEELHLWNCTMLQAHYVFPG